MVSDFPLSIVAASLLSFVVTFFLILWLIKGKANWVLDHPNSRSLHSVPVPRIGGLGLLLGAMVSWLLFSVVLPPLLWVGIVLLISISLLDDIWHAPVWSRLAMQGLVAGGFSSILLLDTYGWLTVMLVTVSIIWVSNLYNFMDGSDGLSGGMALIGFSYYGLLALLAGNEEFALVNFSIAASAAAFLYYNFYPARIFLGDVGAIPLGFLAAVLGVLGWLDGLWSLWLPVLVFSPFIADSTVTLIKRFIRGEKIWHAHREHYYQRIVLGGLGHRNTALLGYVLMVVTGASGVWASNQDFAVQSLIAMIWGSIYLLFMFVFDWYQTHHISRR
ncbi:MAG: glycosyltransferase family 4 protein [Nitrosomonas sp.]|nr:glycosyltransferase family 4 protein [Nitrosomonas sp.]